MECECQHHRCCRDRPSCRRLSAVNTHTVPSSIHPTSHPSHGPCPSLHHLTSSHPTCRSTPLPHTPIKTIRPFKPIVLAHRRQTAIPPQVKELPPAPAPSRQGFSSPPTSAQPVHSRAVFDPPSKRTHPHLHPPPPPSGQGPRLRFTSVPKFGSVSHTLSSSALPPPTRSWSIFGSGRVI